ncbi:hypothetical protein BC941DRAFT_417686 [Chlamydoabsidia padenii]|nr:hypothetical protein BC941DRAFT_417686 [Chlamydoabsidia padenii]
MEVTSFITTPQPSWGEFSSELITLFAISVTCSLFGIKTYNINYRQLTYARWLVILLYVSTWSFLASATILASTNNGNSTSCFLSILACDLFYCSTKMCIYLWLIERSYIVSDGRNRRIDNMYYRFHLLLMTPYIAIFVLMIIYHNAIMTTTGECYIGLQPIANIPVLVYDTIFNLYMTILFVIPLIRVGRGVNKHWKRSKLYDLTKRSLIASTVCLVASFANALSATIMNGQQRGFLCMMCCAIDVTINVFTIHWVTTPSKVQHQPYCTGGISQPSVSTSGNNNNGLDTKDFTNKNTLTTTNPNSSSITRDSILGSLPTSPSVSISIYHQEQQQKSQISASLYSHGNRSSISIQDSQCSTKSLTKSPIDT